MVSRQQHSRNDQSFQHRDLFDGHDWEICPSIMPRNTEALSWALATMARASRGRPAASYSIALRKQAMARSAVWASSVGGMAS
jgi:hypothetical protein